MSESVYISIPMNKSTTMEALDLGKAIQSLCAGIGLKNYSLCLSPDPDEPDASRGEVVELREHPLVFADLLIAYLGIRSPKVDEDLHFADKERKPIVVLFDKGTRVEKAILDISSIASVIEFSDPEDALSQLEIAIYKWQWDLVCGQNKPLIHQN